MLGKAPIEIARVILARWNDNARWNEKYVRFFTNCYGEVDMAQWLGKPYLNPSLDLMDLELSMMHLYYRLQHEDQLIKLYELANFAKEKRNRLEEPRWKKIWRDLTFNPRRTR